jgi:hypothetical protein
MSRLIDETRCEPSPNGYVRPETESHCSYEPSRDSLSFTFLRRVSFIV